MKLASIDDAMVITGHTSRVSFRNYLWRVHKALPSDKKVIRVNGRVDLDSLQEALTLYSRILDEKLKRTTSQTNEKNHQANA